MFNAGVAGKRAEGRREEIALRADHSDAPGCAAKGAPEPAAGSGVILQRRQSGDFVFNAGVAGKGAGGAGKRLRFAPIILMRPGYRRRRAEGAT
ncbi:MAG TPA: hypothetical protein VMJ31_11355, partial [Methylocystis sp.]|nr:hypothetical protein [Methylocystis sp.]